MVRAVETNDAGETMPTFTINSFFFIGPEASSGPGDASFTQELLVYQLLDNISGSFGISNPLPPEAPGTDAGAMSLFYYNDPSDPSSIEFVTLENPGTFEGETAPFGTSGTIVPFGFGDGTTNIPIYLGVVPDGPNNGGGNSSYLVKVSLTVTGPNATAPPPLISPKAKAALNAVTEQLDTLSRGFDMLNATNAAAAGLKSANWVASTATNVLNGQVGLANSVGQAALATVDTLVATTESGGNPVPLILGMVSTTYALAGVVTAALAADPPDGNYTSVYQFPAVTFDVPNASATDNAILQDSWDFLGDTLEMLVASERYQGATLAGDTNSASLQTDAYDAALSASQTDAAKVAGDLPAFQTELANDGYADETSNDGSLPAVQAEIENAGTADPYLASLIGETQGMLGTAGAGAVAQQLVTDVENETAAPISGTVFGAISSASTSLSSYASASLACFLAGTSIRTVLGEVPVEHLAPGERVVVEAAEDLEAPVIWIGHRRVDASRYPDPHAVWPVRIAAGTFGFGRPYRDLFLSPDHAIFANGVLVPVKYLMDGRSIVQVPMARPVYFHVELPRHVVLFANGLAAESWLDTGDRASFDDAGSVVRLFVDFPARGLAVRREAEACAPVVVSGPPLASVRALVAAGRPRSVKREAPAVRGTVALSALRL